MKKTKQDGFSAVELLLGLVVASLLVFAGFYVWQNVKTNSSAPQDSVSNHASADGHVCYKSEGDIYCYDIAKKTHKKISDQVPDIEGYTSVVPSPDGTKYFVATEEVDTKLVEDKSVETTYYIASKDLQNLEKLSFNGGFFGEVSWNKDSSGFYFLSVGEQGEEMQGTQIVHYDLKTKKTTTLTKDSEMNYSLPLLLDNDNTIITTRDGEEFERIVLSLSKNGANAQEIGMLPVGYFPDFIPDTSSESVILKGDTDHPHIVVELNNFLTGNFKGTKIPENTSGNIFGVTSSHYVFYLFSNDVQTGFELIDKQDGKKKTVTFEDGKGEMLYVLPN